MSSVFNTNTDYSSVKNTGCCAQIGVIAFADDVQYPDDSCYSEGLALVTSTNKKKLSDFAVSIHPSQSQANYIKAFTEAFRLLAATNNNSVMTSGRRGMNLTLTSQSLTYDSP